MAAENQETINRIIELILEESDKYTHPDLAERIYHVKSQLDDKLSEIMRQAAEYRRIKDGSHT